MTERRTALTRKGNHAYTALRIRDGLLIGMAQAITLILVIALITMILGNQQQRALNDIRNSNRAISCVLTLPVTSEGRSEARVNGLCLVPNGLAPIDIDGDGRIASRP